MYIMCAHVQWLNVFFLEIVRLLFALKYRNNFIACHEISCLLHSDPRSFTNEYFSGRISKEKALMKIHFLFCLSPSRFLRNVSVCDLFWTYFPKVSLCDLYAVYMTAYLLLSILNASINLCGNWVHLRGLLRKSLPSVCVSLCLSLLSLQGNGWVQYYVPPFGARQRLGKHVPAAKNTRDKRMVGYVISVAVRVLSKECLWVSLFIPLSLLGEN
jgi:hypothetical protein